MIRIEALELDHANEAIDLVILLLKELADDPGRVNLLDRGKIIDDWTAHPDRFQVFVARTDTDVVIGIITVVECFAIYAGGAFGIINELYVAPDWRSKAVGRQLLDEVKNSARSCGWQRLDVTAPAGEQWQRTVRFYEREGFTCTGPKLKFLVT